MAVVLTIRLYLPYLLHPFHIAGFPANGCHTLSWLVEGGGFEPPKAWPTDLQSVPFDRSGTPPDVELFKRVTEKTPLYFFATERPCWSQRRDSNPRPTDYKSVALPD